MKKRKQISTQAIQCKILERDQRRAHILECNETRSKGYMANNEMLLAQIEEQYQAGEISIHQYEWAMKMLKAVGDMKGE